MLKGVIIYTNGYCMYLEGGSFDASENKVRPVMNGTLYDLTQILGEEKAKECFEEPWKLEAMIPAPYTNYDDFYKDIPLPNRNKEDKMVIRVGTKPPDRDIFEEMLKKFKRKNQNEHI